MSLSGNTAGIPRSTNEEERQRNIRLATKQTSEINNPCLKEQKLSYSCLEDNGYDREKCTVYFANYRACQGFWLMIRKERRMKGIVPELPPVHEREKIKEEYLARVNR